MEEELTLLKKDDEVLQKLVKFPDKRWLLVMARSRKEKYSAKISADNGIITYIPLITKVEIHNRSKREVLLPMFPGYFFACASYEEQSFLRRESGVWNLKVLTDIEENSLLQDLYKVRESELLSAKHKLIVNPGIHVGDLVTIKRGPFKGQQVIVVERVKSAQLIVNLDFLGQNIDITCDADELIY